jgi:hypothetical protein
MGVGGGLFANLLMTFYGRPIHQAVATSSAIAVLISIPGALGYVYAGWPAAARFPDVAALQLPFTLGYVSLIGAILVMPTTLITAPIGVRVARAGDGVRRLHVHRRREVCGQPSEWPVATAGQLGRVAALSAFNRTSLCRHLRTSPWFSMKPASAKASMRAAII